MNYKTLGNTGLNVSGICLGTMTFGNKGFFKAMGSLGQPTADKLVKHAVDGGINFIDTANVYSEGLSEEFTGQAIRNLGLHRDDLVLATKVKAPMGSGPNDVGLSRKHILRQVDASLRRLKTDYIDLYQIHSVFPWEQVEEALNTLNSLIVTGKVRYIGVSNISSWQLMKALAYSTSLHIERFASLQAYYSLAVRDVERELLPLVQDQKLGLLIYSPLSGGLLSGKYDRDDQAAIEGRLRQPFTAMPGDRDKAFAILDVLRPMAEAKQTSVAQLALAWLRYQPAVTSVIIGATKESQLQDNLKSLDVTFTADELRQLDEVSKLTAEYPQSLFETIANVNF
ncbi:aldo/keto reductase [Spirosoma spitsbergense]|uniref:aldo/keto reductase n=1 Tax=Spirosoma spitsbergense TaxID=431554 RepID=UPI000378A76D|nr:aldo/keto reductase [Spirosoma spitsbergense]